MTVQLEDLSHDSSGQTYRDLLSFLGFLIMLTSAWYGEKNLRRVGRAGLQQVTGNARGGPNVRGYFGDAGQRMRNRLNNPEKDDD